MTEPLPAEPARRLWRISLQAKVLGVVLVCVGLPLLITGAYFLQRNHELLSERGREVLANSVYRKATELDVWARQRQEEAQRWAASFVVFEGLEALSPPGPDAASVRAELNDFLASLLPHHPAYESLQVVDSRGRPLAGTREEGPNGWLARLAESGAVGVTVFSPLLPTPEGRRAWLLVQPVRGRKDQVVGYIVGRLEQREIERLLITEQESLSFWLLDGDGRILARAGHIVEKPGEFFPASLEQVAGAGRAVYAGPLPGQGPALYSLRQLEGPLKAYVAASLPLAAAYQPLAEARNRLLLAGLAVTTVLLLLAYLAARRVLRPILLLSQAAGQVSAGNMDVELPVQGRDEIADLTVAFNEMARRIREARGRLEETRDDLARANQGLTEANRTLETLAITDGLTGLYNRRHFQDVIEREIARCQREGRPLSLLLGDLDHFKAYNDRWGHQEGDAALRRVASVILNTIRHSDQAFRYGGEELAVLLPACGKEQAREVAEKIRAAVHGPQDARALRFRAHNTISVGVATAPDDARVARGLVDVADAALYEAKAHGRDRVVAAGDPGAPAPEPQESVG